MIGFLILLVLVSVMGLLVILKIAESLIPGTMPFGKRIVIWIFLGIPAVLLFNFVQNFDIHDWVPNIYQQHLVQNESNQDEPGSRADIIRREVTQSEQQRRNDAVNGIRCMDKWQDNCCSMRFTANGRQVVRDVCGSLRQRNWAQ